MHIDLSRDPIEVTREDGRYDAFVLDFLSRFPAGWDHVLVSGYVAILFGRERMTEDIDLLVTPPTDGQFAALWDALHPEYWCLQTDDLEDARDGYLRDGIALRFARAGTVEPNVEVKIGRDEAGAYALAARRPVRLNGRLLHVAPLEQQVAYKLRLGSDKDLEDALHMVGALRAILKRSEVESWVRALGVPPARLARVWP